MQNLTITLLQSNLHWENTTANLAMFEEKIWKIGRPTDLIILPEMFSTGFSMNVEKLAEKMNMQTFRWMKQMAAQTGALILGSVMMEEEGKYLNRLLWMEPSGEFKTYDKRHLFRMAEEHKKYSPGKSRLIGIWKGWRICPLVCYDLRFPVWSRNSGNGKEALDYDLLVYVANWPQPRVGAWDALLKARAIENLCYLAGVNRVGTDGGGIPHSGHSTVIGPRGEEIWQAGESEAIHSVSLDANALEEYRSKFPAHLDADRFTVN